MLKKLFTEQKHISTGSPLEYGVAIVETAIVLPVITLIMIGLVDVGVMLINYMTLTQITHEGVRLASNISDLGDEDRNYQISCTYNADRKCIGENLVASGGPEPDKLLPIARRIMHLSNLEELPFSGPLTVTITQTTGNILDPTKNLLVNVETKYDSFFNLFDGFPLKSSATGPYLYLN